MNWHECMEHDANIMFKTMIRIIIFQALVWWCNKKNNVLYSASDNLNYDLCIEDIKKIKKAQEMYRINKCKRKRMLNEYRYSVKEKMRKLI